jgi:tetratricopeptide (TPR) repeat protein
LGRDYQGSLVSHDCAVVFVGDEALLVDPAYHWFGVPHKEFVVLDDVQAVAHHFFQHTASERNVSRCRLAAKLHPDFAWGQLCLAGALFAADEREEAQKALEAAEQLESGRWDAYRLRGLMAINGNEWDTTISHLHKALELNPEDAESHFFLGTALAGQGKQEEAREEYRACLLNRPRDIVADRARRAIVQINETIGSESASQSELLAYYEHVKAGRFIKSTKLHIRLIDIRSSKIKPSQIKASENETPKEVALRIATQLCERANKGEDFGELAKTYSHGHRQADGGLWPPFTPGSLAPPFDVLQEYARNMEPGEVSQPIYKEGHVFILKLEQRVPKSVQLFDEVKDTLEEELRDIKRKRLEEAMNSQ